MPKKKKGQRADGLIEIARKMPSGKVRHFYGHSRAECEDKYRRALVCFSAQQAQEAAGPNYGRVRASRHSLLGQSAYSSGLQANSPLTTWTGCGIIRVQSVTMWAGCRCIKVPYCHTENPTL